MADSRVRWLLGVAGALALARFVIVPWAETQNEQRQQLEVLTKRLDRSEGVVKNREAILAAQETLQKDADSVLKIFPSSPGDDEARLAAQRRITALATQSGLKVTLFDWLLNGEVEEAGLAYSRASVKLEGPLDKLILLHVELELALTFAAIREFEVNSRSQMDGPVSVATSASVVLDLFYRPVQAAAVASVASP